MVSMLWTFLFLSLLGGVPVFSAAGQFVFTSDRPAAGQNTGQFDVYLYDSGEVSNVTLTEDTDEFDPQTSPSGRYLAFFVTDTYSEGAAKSSGWALRIIELKTGAVISEWDLPGSKGHTRPAGGFMLAWLPGENALLVPGVGHDSNWAVYRYEVDTAKANFLTTGYDVILSPEASRCAIAYEGWAWVFDLELLTSEPLASGDPLAWTSAGVVVGTSDSLQVIDPADTTGAAHELLAGAAYYVK